MMRRHFLVLGFTIAAGCAAEPTALPTATGGLEVRVAPLTLDGITNARYELTVTNGAGGGGEIVWQKTVESQQYGSGSGSLSYVGTCDADTGVNTVSVELRALYDAGGAVATSVYDNPGVLSLDVACVADEDVAVTFDMTIARQAQQGFFDVAVEFDDIFCSAKVDCLDGDDQPLRLLFDEAGARNTTAVMGLACTEGLGGDGTDLYRTAVTIDCPGVDDDALLDPSAGPGNAWASATTGPIFQYAVFEGNESLPSAGQAISKVYWNVAVGLDLDQLPAGCHLVGSATASSGPLEGWQTPAGSSYPVIDYDVPLTDAGGLACTRHPLNGPSSGVAIRYTDLDAPETFDYSYANGASLPAGPSGASPGTAAVNCAQLHVDYPDLPDGDYWIDPDGSGGDAPFETYCDMTTDGGGWTLVKFSGITCLTAGATNCYCEHVDTSLNGAWQGITDSQVHGVDPNEWGGIDTLLFDGRYAPLTWTEGLFLLTSGTNDTCAENPAASRWMVYSHDEHPCVGGATESQAIAFHKYGSHWCTAPAASSTIDFVYLIR